MLALQAKSKSLSSPVVTFKVVSSTYALKIRSPTFESVPELLFLNRQNS